MTFDEILTRLGKIHDSAGDPEAAHALEDRLYVDVLRAIARGSVAVEDVQMIAGGALIATTYDFPRWCA